MNRARLRTVLAIICSVCALGISLAWATDEMWVHYSSDTGVFKTRFPENKQTNIQNFAIGDGLAASSEETVAAVDLRPDSDVLKSYIVKFDQTIGNALTEAEMNALLELELALYEDFYIDQYKGSVTIKEKRTLNDDHVANLELDYADPVFGPQSLRLYVIITPNTRLEQLVIGPKSVMHSLRSNDFFKSLGFTDGLLVTDQKLDEVWKPVAGPLNMYTYYVPPLTPPYFPDPPKIDFNRKEDKVALAFRDPVRSQSVYYNLYAYKFERAIRPQDALQILKTKHLARLMKNTDYTRVRMVRLNDGSYEFTYAITIDPPKGYPSLDTVRMRSYLRGDSMMVQEIIGPRALAMSKFMDKVSTMIEFHPDDFYVPQPGQAVPGMTPEEADLINPRMEKFGPPSPYRSIVPHKTPLASFMAKPSSPPQASP